MMTSCVLPNGHTLDLFEPRSSGIVPMRSGTCPGCHESLFNYIGHYATIRELNEQGLVVTNSPYVRPYGHLSCMMEIFAELQTELTLPDDPEELTWIEGRQKDLLDFLKENQGFIIECSRDDSLPQTVRYRYRIVEDQ